MTPPSKGQNNEWVNQGFWDTHLKSEVIVHPHLAPPRRARTEMFFKNSIQLSYLSRWEMGPNKFKQPVAVPDIGASITPLLSALVWVLTLSLSLTNNLDQVA